MKLLASLFAAFIIGVIALANTGQLGPYFGWVNKIPAGDKLGHLILMGTLCLLVNLALSCRSARLGGWSLPLGTLVISTLVLLEEFSQIFIPTRSFDLVDLAADALGISLATLAALRLHKRRSPQEPTQP